MIISHTHHFIYFGAPRTGSTSLSTLFVERFGAVHEYDPKWDVGPNQFHSLRGKAQHQICLPLEFREYLTILSVRDPYTRFLSMYEHFKSYHGCTTIDEYCEFALPPISFQICQEIPGCVQARVDRLIRFESFENDVNQLPFMSSHVELPHERKRSTPLQPLTPLLISFVNRYYRDDFDRFGYRKLPCPPT